LIPDLYANELDSLLSSGTDTSLELKKAGGFTPPLPLLRLRPLPANLYACCFLLAFAGAFFTFRNLCPGLCRQILYGLNGTRKSRLGF